LFDNAVKRARKETLQDAVESIRSRFGKRAITYATLLGNLKMPDDGRDSVKMPGLMYQ
jgi:DNA polymerase-4